MLRFCSRRFVLLVAVVLGTIVASATLANAQGRAHGHGSVTGQFMRHNDIVPAPLEEATDFTADLTRDFNASYDRYLAFKKRLKDDFNITYSIQSSYFLQGATPDGGKAVNLYVWSPSVSWKPFSDTAIGSGLFKVAFSQQQFLTSTDTAIQNSLMGTITAPNDWSTDSYSWSQLSYTHTLPGTMDWLSATIGQYSFGQFDGDKYAGNAQTSFITYALAQNATQTYADGGVGAYLSAALPHTDVSISGGMQGATDVPGKKISIDGYETGKYAYFGNILWTPTFEGLGSGSYNFLVYHQPSVPLQPSSSIGYSFAASQSLGAQYGIFLRANYASGDAIPIRSSLGGGGIVNDPFGRHPNDQFGMGVFLNKANTRNETVISADTPRDTEYGAEFYYNYTILKGLQITPEFAVFVNPVLLPDRSASYLFTLRLTSFL